MSIIAMASAVERRARSAWLVRRRVSHGGLILPPASLRRCTAEFRDDEFFLGSARAEARRLVERCGLTDECRVLDIGCGAGRLPIGLLSLEQEVGSYVGLDVDRVAIGWCRRWIGRGRRRYRFRHLDVRNERYNPAGVLRLDEGFRLGFPDRSFDVIYLYSVFTHMTAGDIEAYLREMGRVLAPGGHVFLTAYLEEGVPAVSVNPAGYRDATATPLHRVRLERVFFERLVGASGLVIEGLEHGAEHDGQTGVYLAASARASGKAA